MQNMQNFNFSPLTAQLHFRCHRVTWNLPIGYFGVPEQNMQIDVKYAKFSFFAQNVKTAQLCFKCHRVT